MSNRDKVLDDYVQLIDYMGTDLDVVNAARVSMNKESELELDWEYDVCDCCEPTEFYGLSEKDKKLIKYLAKHEHWTPFSQNAVKFRIKMPIFIARQWFKHTVGFTRNEVSRRYVSDSPEFWEPESWRKAADNVKQGSSEINIGGWIGTGNTCYLGETYTGAIYQLQEFYEMMIEHGVCPEQARMVLPQSMMTEFIETGNLASYARLCKLRLDPHAQKEIQWYAEAIASGMEELFPISWEALMEEEL